MAPKAPSEAPRKAVCSSGPRQTALQPASIAKTISVAPKAAMLQFYTDQTVGTSTLRGKQANRRIQRAGPIAVRVQGRSVSGRGRHRARSARRRAGQEVQRQAH